MKCVRSSMYARSIPSSAPQELEQVEDVWRGEAQDLLSQIAQLQADNKSLLMSLSHKDSPVIKEELQKPEGIQSRV